jgi:hypothetical protein
VAGHAGGDPGRPLAPVDLARCATFGVPFGAGWAAFGGDPFFGLGVVVLITLAGTYLLWRRRRGSESTDSCQPSYRADTP